jgi:hypothetical protein
MTVTAGGRSRLEELVEELVEAHYDTIEIALGTRSADCDDWAAHLEYLKRLSQAAFTLLAERSVAWGDRHR